MLFIRNELVIQLYKSYHNLSLFNHKHHYDLSHKLQSDKKRVYVLLLVRVYIRTSIFRARLRQLFRSPSPVIAMLFPLRATPTMVLSCITPLDLNRMRLPTVSCTISRVSRCHCWGVGSSWIMFILRFWCCREYYITEIHHIISYHYLFPFHNTHHYDLSHFHIRSRAIKNGSLFYYW